jgi:hypothetical protein
LKWFAFAWGRDDIWAALGLSVRVALTSTAVAIVLGTLAAAAIYRSRFFGREAITGRRTMLELDLTDAQRDLQAKARAFARDVVAPKAVDAKVRYWAAARPSLRAASPCSIYSIAWLVVTTGA